LIVDRQQAIQRALERQMCSWKMRCESASSNDEALQMLYSAVQQDDAFAVVVTEFLMEGMDGPKLARAIKSDPALNKAAVVMLASLGHVSQVMKMIGREADASLLKPVRQAQLLTTLTEVVTKNAVNPGTPQPLPETREQLIPRQLEALPDLMHKPNADDPRILVAEDNIVNQKVTIRMLERLGLRADVAVNGRQAVQMDATTPYDLVLMDCQMPEMDGWQATAEIRKHENGRRHIIIAMTAEALARDRCLEAGMDDFIPKPVKFEDLAEMLQKWTPPPRC
jgi:CheY-like chemotaxis protein